ncbi:hypothetical protein GOODEAATRI_012773 [Goodea atripinnis]|uniref:Uncharacterized protein n=1 Tax=Goodea atripinnis TaxID=208336 RepID=A0ABV0PNC4_9TELE
MVSLVCNLQVFLGAQRKHWKLDRQGRALDSVLQEGLSEERRGDSREAPQEEETRLGIDPRNRVVSLARKDSKD